MRRLKVFTWHVHGSYLASLAQVACDWYLPVKPGRPEGYGGRGSLLADNLHEVPAEEVADLEVDVVLTQSVRNWTVDRHELLSPDQLARPRIHLEHDPPQGHPTDTRHPVDDAEALIVHVTAFNQLMWDSGATPTRVIEHGVARPDVRATGELARGLVVVNHLARRGRRLGADVFDRARRDVPLDLVGMGASELGGVGEVPRDELAAFSAPYRFFFHPIRYTSLGLALCEAMMLGLPVVGLATTELATVIDDGRSGYVHTDLEVLIARMGDLLADPDQARALGDEARRVAERRFGLERFVAEWDDTLSAAVAGGGRSGARGTADRRGFRMLGGFAAESAAVLPALAGFAGGPLGPRLRLPAQPLRPQRGDRTGPFLGPEGGGQRRCGAGGHMTHGVVNGGRPDLATDGTHDLAVLVDRFSTRHVLVVGEAMLDVYLDGHATGLSREAPAPVVALRSRRHAPGGAANTAANLAALGAAVQLVSVVGDDAEGALLVAALNHAGVDTSKVVCRRRAVTIAKQRVVADGQIVARLDQGGDQPPDLATEDLLVAALGHADGPVDAVVVSDNGAGLMTPRLRRAAAEAQAEAPGLLVVDARDSGAYRDVAPSVVKPNYDEAVRLLGARHLDPGPARAEQIQAGSEALLAHTGARLVCVTLDADGALLLEAYQPPYRTYARAVSNPRVSGAGDTFVSALALALAAGGAPRAAVELAGGAAELVVAEAGTSVCAASALRQHLAGADKTTSRTALAERVDDHRRAGRRIVFTNGCFDLLHRGHVGYLSRAKALGDVLVVGVNTDASVRRLKGTDRPVCDEGARVRVLSALSCIDHVVLFDQDTPSEVIEEIHPDVYVKGGDYSRERLPEAAQVERLGGTLHFLPYEDESTTSIIERIRTGGR